MELDVSFQLFITIISKFSSFLLYQALMELTETQLQRNFGMDTITRQKFLTAVENRREAIENPGEVYDSRL